MRVPAWEFKGQLRVTGLANGTTLYTLRGSMMAAMKDANLPHPEMCYLPPRCRGGGSHMSP